jgi:hypothetical protein
MPQEAALAKTTRFCELIISVLTNTIPMQDLILLSYFEHNLPLALTDDKSNRISNVKTSNQV